MLLATLLFLTTPAMAEGDLEMFEEICEVTGEVRRGYRLKEIKLDNYGQGQTTEGYQEIQ